MSFDYYSYLARLDPGCSYKVEKLTGGVINFTVRASKITTATDIDESCETQASDLGVGRFPGRSSLILKYAPPYLAEVGPEAPMSQTRQSIEAAALSIFPPPNSTSERAVFSDQPSTRTLFAETGVTVPELLLYDERSHVLVLSDLGPRPDLSNIFNELGGYTPDTPTPCPAPPAGSPRLGTPLTESQARKFVAAGRKLGAFFAQLHDPQTRKYIVDSARNFPSLPELQTVIHEQAISPVKKRLLQFPSLLDGTEAEKLFAAVEANFLRATPDEEQTMVLGDCWSGAILVDLGRDLNDVGVSVIDWEFASLTGRGIDGDIAQFLAHMELYRIAAEHRGYDVAHAHLTALAALTGSLIDEYRAYNSSRSIDRQKESLARSALLSHGAEIINCAFWKVWECDPRRCAACLKKSSQENIVDSGDEQSRTIATTEQLNTSDIETENAQACILVTKMVETGIRFLRLATTEDPLSTVKGTIFGSPVLPMERPLSNGLLDLFVVS